MRTLQKPTDYSEVMRCDSERLQNQYLMLERSITNAFEEAASSLAVGNSKRRRRVSHAEMKAAHEPVWRYYDLEARSVLYLSYQDRGKFSRDSLSRIKTEDHGISGDRIATYCEEFPDSLFSHHCDLDWYSGSMEKSSVSEISSFFVEEVVPEFVYFVRAGFTRPFSVTRSCFVSLRDDTMLLLDTWDYAEILDFESDGSCYYIQ